jgi:hypothetical protein
VTVCNHVRTHLASNCNPQVTRLVVLPQLSWGDLPECGQERMCVSVGAKASIPAEQAQHTL